MISDSVPYSKARKDLSKTFRKTMALCKEKEARDTNLRNSYNYSKTVQSASVKSLEDYTSDALSYLRVF